MTASDDLVGHLGDIRGTDLPEAAVEQEDVTFAVEIGLEHDVVAVPAYTPAGLAAKARLAPQARLHPRSRAGLRARAVVVAHGGSAAGSGLMAGAMTLTEPVARAHRLNRHLQP